jgi:penicillin amidase
LDAADLAAVARSPGSIRQTEWVFIPVRLGKFRIPVGPVRVHRYSDRLPVLPIELDGVGAEQDIILRWSGYHLKPADLDSLFSITEARSAADADRRLAQVGLPSWNYVFGDQDGKVGYRAVGRIPRRLQAPRVGVSTLPKDQSPLEWDFKPSDFLTSEEMPHLFAPKRGFIVTANARQWPSDSHFHGGRAYAQAFRAQRIEELLSAQPHHDQSSLQKIQCDVFAQDAKLFLPVLLDALLGEQR